MNTTEESAPSDVERTEYFAELRGRMVAELAAWKVWVARRDLGGTVITGTPFVVYCEGGLAIRLEGDASIPVWVKPGLVGVSHFDRRIADVVAKLRGTPYRVVGARQVPEIRIHELEQLIVGLDEMVARVVA